MRSFLLPLAPRRVLYLIRGRIKFQNGKYTRTIAETTSIKVSFASELSSRRRADTPRSKSPAVFSHHIWSFPVFFPRKIYPPRVKEVLRRRSPSTPALYYCRIIRRPFIYCIVFVLNWGNSSSRACGVFRAWFSFLQLNFSVVWRMDTVWRQSWRSTASFAQIIVLVWALKQAMIIICRSGFWGPRVSQFSQRKLTVKIEGALYTLRGRKNNKSWVMAAKKGP